MMNIAFAETVNLSSGAVQAATSTSPAEMIGQIYNVGLMIGGILAVGFVIWGGARYIFNAGNPSGTSAAKDNIYNALIGLVLLLGAYIILHTINPSLTSLTMPELQPIPTTTVSGGGAGAGVTVTTGGLSPSNLSDAQARGELVNGISVNHPEPQTSLKGMQQSTIDYINQLKQSCGCDLVITAGTENIKHNDSGGYSHQNGYKFDLRPTSEVSNYITSTLTPMSPRSDGAAQWTNGNGVVFAREGDHWDVVVKP